MSRRHVLNQLGAVLTAAGTYPSLNCYNYGLVQLNSTSLLSLTRAIHVGSIFGCQHLNSLLRPASFSASETSHHRHFHSTNSSRARDFYETLELPRGASDAEIKKAYYRLAKQYHPDTNTGDPESAKKFQEVQRAYDTLRDPQKRGAYDSMGHQAYERMEAGGGMPGGGGGGPGGAGPFGAGMQVDPEDLFREFFGGAGGGGGNGYQGTIFEHLFGGRGGFAQPRKGRTVQTAMTLSFEEAVKGATKFVDLSSLGIPGLDAQRVEVTIPAGIDSGQVLTVAGKGAPGPKGLPPGDLMIQVMVRPSMHGLVRDGFDLHVEIPVNMVDAALGSTVEVPTVEGGKAEVKVKPGTQPGDKLRMRGYGVPMDVIGYRGRRGDQYVKIKVTVPKHMSEQQRQLLEQFKTGKKPQQAASAEEEGTQQKKKFGWFR